MPTQIKETNVVANLEAVREFLISGREIPQEIRHRKPVQNSFSTVPVHNGITRARSRSTSKI